MNLIIKDTDESKAGCRPGGTMNDNLKSDAALTWDEINMLLDGLKETVFSESESAVRKKEKLREILAELFYFAIDSKNKSDKEILLSICSRLALNLHE